ncbi:MAG TPA: L,D-transpeptidase [Ktedonobacteraceae bacterium]|nr:L,D-transpeptidase [Ktedonobacteraceae bacterium]
MRQRCSGIFTFLLLTGLLFLNACKNTGASYADTQLQHGSQPTVSRLLQQQGQLQLQTFRQWIALLEQFKGDIRPYQQNYTSDQQALQAASNDDAYQSALNTLVEHIKSIKIPALKAEVDERIQQLSQQAASWSKDHTYHDQYNNTTYHLGYEYGSDGIGGVIADEIAEAKTLADYQQAIENTNAALFSLQAYQTNTNDSTRWNKTHQTDLQLMQHYGFTHEKVLVISLSEQALRVYNSNKLVKAFHVTTGRPEKPSLPGSWWVETKLSPTIFKSDAPPGSAYWYPATPIHYAMLYHSGGYFIHDSWWRSDYGPDTQFPHRDSSGDSFSFDGSHGCVNLSETNAAWLYNYTDPYTRVLIY